MKPSTLTGRVIPPPGQTDLTALKELQLLANPKTGEIIGGACLGPVGGELIHEIIACMHKRMTVHELAAMPHYHPTLAEIWTYPAEELSDKIKALQ